VKVGGLGAVALLEGGGGVGEARAVHVHRRAMLPATPVSAFNSSIV